MDQLTFKSLREHAGIGWGLVAWLYMLEMAESVREAETGWSAFYAVCMTIAGFTAMWTFNVTEKK